MNESTNKGRQDLKIVQIFFLEVATSRCWDSHLGISKMVIRRPMRVGHKETGSDSLASNSHVHFHAARCIH